MSVIGIFIWTVNKSRKTEVGIFVYTKTFKFPERRWAHVEMPDYFEMRSSKMNGSYCSNKFTEEHHMIWKKSSFLHANVNRKSCMHYPFLRHASAKCWQKTGKFIFINVDHSYIWWIIILRFKVSSRCIRKLSSTCQILCTKYSSEHNAECCENWFIWHQTSIKNYGCHDICISLVFGYDPGIG